MEAVYILGRSDCIADRPLINVIYSENKDEYSQDKQTQSSSNSIMIDKINPNTSRTDHTNQSHLTFPVFTYLAEAAGPAGRSHDGLR